MHQPVLLKEILEYLAPREGDIVLDATYGSGGHARELCRRIGRSGKLIGIEQDEEILATAGSLARAILVNDNFRNLDRILKNLKIKKINKALFDLGMNSEQIEKSGRGFSFQKNEPLHMNYKARLSPSDLTAREILNRWSCDEIYRILREYGEERFAGKISDAIVKYRKMKKFETTFDLVAAIEEGVPGFYKRARLHPATRTFQALRIAVNDELAALTEGLELAWKFLAQNGRLAVISFHSLEDRIVKNFFRQKKEEDEGIILTKKPVVPKDEEIRKNPRSRSAKLRVIQKK